MSPGQANTRRIESLDEVETHLARLEYAIENGSTVNLQRRRDDNRRNPKHTSRYTIGCLFPNESEGVVLRRELSLLTVENYIETLRDIRYPRRSEWRVFGKAYSGEDLYIKVRIEAAKGSVIVMSFHFSDRHFKEYNFPYRRSERE